MTTPTTFRPACPDDALCLSVMAMQVFLETYAPQGLRPDLAREALSVYSTQAMAAQLADPLQRVLLAEVNGHLVGFVAVAQDRACPVPHAAQVEITRLYLLRNFQRQGLGRALALQAEGIAVEWGQQALWLTAWAGNAKALAFYPALGYADIGRWDYRFEGQAFENRMFVKRWA